MTDVETTADHDRPARAALIDAGDDVPEGALAVLRRGIAASPELKRGLVATSLMGLSVAVGRLVIPVLIERALNQGVLGDEVDTGIVVRLSVVALAIVVVASFGSWITNRRLVERAEEAIANLRTRAFARVHRLSIADHSETRRGVLVARVTSDTEALARFAQWGLFSWTIHPTMILGTFAVLTWYSWQIALVVAVAYLPVIPALRWLQRRQLSAYDELRTRVAEMLSGFSEAVMGAAVVKAYGVEGRTRGRLHQAIDARYRARLRANRYMASVFIVGDVFGALAFVGAMVLGVVYREPWGLTAGELVACLFLTTLLHGPISELGETLDQTQTAVAGWRKILNLLDHPVDVVEPTNGQVLEPGAISIRTTSLDFAYREGPPVLTDVSVDIPAGTNVAVVGETGSGKTTFAKLLCRLADPVAGSIELGGVALRELSPDGRHAAVRMVPQDGFLFDVSVGENVRYGRPGATDEDIADAFRSLDLEWWVAKLPAGLDTVVGERGDNLSVGERQLVALVRAALADPGLLILDEATSAVDPETDQALTTAIRRLAAGRTVLSIAHRLATAEAADRILVFDRGRLAEQGSHDELLAAGGLYSGLHAAWVGNTRRVA